MLRVGLTGGIGAGKSTVARRLAEHGAVVLDADRIAREVVEPGTEGLAEVVAAFGTDVLTADGALDRAALAGRVFGDDAARQRLNAILHPRIGARTAELMAAAPPDAIVVHDVPLLVENGLAPTYHLVLVVHADVRARVRRLAATRGMTERDARARVAAQASDEQRRAAADVWLDNTGEPERVLADVDVLWTDRLVPFEANVRYGRGAQCSVPVLVEPDPTWPAQAERLAARVRLAAGETALRVDHVGSTAVPGLAAKDVIDLQLTVASLDDADAIAGALGQAGFPYLPGFDQDDPKPGDPDPERWRKRVHTNADPGRRVNLHVRVLGSPGWRQTLLFRDWLRADAPARTEYEQLKRRLVKEDVDIEGYVAGKRPWFDDALPRAENWARRTGWTP
ncbi:dephospho-CoA kinase [Gandjariella thermophila]|uniref:Dephospho-CoA kinase n=1 Tax=Gandjariella thermophila TaxID=1931992 RepID=A0A4D4J6H6_9PSEU|nr:dephospho-CoA kinase [Gandjariella thermophila]GDY31084.1 dephospho-CoA kinase [Gandjariella thermophila]